ncbi:hypothetical protein Tco_1472351 [Tanacetum coccineum]
MHWCEAILRVNEGVREHWASCNTYKNECDGGDFPDSNVKRYWESTNDDTDEGWEDPEKCGEEKIDAILDTVFDKLDDSWFSGETQDEDDLDRITDYLEPTSYDGFINSEDEAYKERLCNFLGMPYRKPPPIDLSARKSNLMSSRLIIKWSKYCYR